MIGIQVKGLERIMHSVDPKIQKDLQAASIAVGMELRRRLRVYPNLVRFQKGIGRSLRWQSAKQRAYYHAMRRERGLPDRYRRQTDPMSQRLKMKWTVVRYQAVGAKVTNSATYAPYVQNWEKQQLFHKDAGWTTDKQAVERVQADGTVRRIFDDALAKIAARR